MSAYTQHEADGLDGVNGDRNSPEQSSIKAQLQTSANMIPAHVWYATPTGALVFVNSRIADYLGLPHDHPLRFGIDVGREWDSHIAFLHPDDHEETRRVWSTCLRTGCPGEVAFRGRDAEGRYKWFLSRAEPVRAANGSVLFWVGVNFDIDAQKRAQQEIRDIIETIPAIVWVALPDGSNIYVNSRYVEYSGVTSEQTAGAGWRMAAHPDDLQKHEGKWRRSVASGEPHESEVRFRQADGEYRWHLDRGQPLRDEDGNIVRWYGVVTDIEDRKRVEEALRRSEHFLAEAQRLSHTGSAGMEAGTKRMFWSEETARIYGYAPGTEPTPDLILQRVHPDDVGLLKSAIERAGQAGSDFDFEHRLLMPDGSLKYIRNLVHSLRYSDGHEESVGAIMDITEHKLTEEAIRRSEAYLAEAQRLSHTGSWGWNVEDRSAAHLSEEWYRIYGFDSADGPPDWENRLARVHPQDRFKWKDAIDTAILEEADYEVDFRIVLPDGKLKWIHTVGHPVRTSSGKLIQFLGSSADITERKQAEEKLKEQEMELRQVLDLAPQLIAVFGPQRERLYLNRVSLDYFGITLDQWCEARPGNEVHPDDTERLRSQWGRAISSGFAFEIEVRFRRNDGIHRWFLIRCNPVCDDQGRVIRWYAACTDIEDRKRAEESLQRENAALREELNQASMFEEIVGSSEPLRKVLTQVSKVAPTDSTVLILGQTGTGKELIARAIHKRSRRAARSFIGVNCGAIPTSLIASELFGHEKGAFTGATQRRLGRFEAANGGTIFLDEVGDLPPDIQIALLRVLQEREIERVGSDKPISVDVRVLAATHRDLDKLVSEGKFREDLLYRLNVVPIVMPSLHERSADIPILVEYFIARFGKKMGKKFQTIERKTLKMMQEYAWPGNVRELQNVIERAVTLSDSNTFAVDQAWLKREPAEVPHSSEALNGVLLAREKEVIEAALAQSHGRISGPAGAAAKLGVPDSTLEAKVKRLGIDKYRFKSKVG